MKLDNLHQKLITAARAEQPSERVPYAFEKRVMAHITSNSAVDLLGAWSAALWRAAASCVVVSIVACAFVIWSGKHQEPDFSHEFDAAVFASAGSASDVW
jgi:hypothetical protein